MNSTFMEATWVERVERWIALSSPTQELFCGVTR